MTISPDVVHHCLDYQRRTGLKNSYISVYRLGNGWVRVIISCEDRFGDFIEQDVCVDATARRMDECIYEAAVLCAESLMAQQSTIH